MTFNITKILSSKRTHSNGEINKDYDHQQEKGYDPETYNEYVDQNTPVKPTTFFNYMDMNKEELIDHAMEYHNLKLHRKMSEGMMLKEIYDCVNKSGYVASSTRNKKVRGSGEPPVDPT